MDRICARCGEKLQENDFLCPKCGAVYGQPVYTPPVPPKPSEETLPEETLVQEYLAPARKWPVSLILGGILVLVALLLALLDPFPEQMQASGTTDITVTTHPPTTSPPTTQPPLTLEERILGSYSEKYCQGSLTIENAEAQVLQVFGDTTYALLSWLDYNAQDECVEAVEDLLFYYAPGQRLVAFHKDQVYTIADSLRARITVIPTRELLDIYRSACPEMYQYDGPLPPKIELSEVQRAQLRDIMGSNEQDCTIYYWSFDFAVVGFDVILDNISSIRTIQVGNVAFREAGEVLLVLANGTYQTISQAYQNGLITYEQLRKAFESHRQHKPLLYYDWNHISQEAIEAQLRRECDLWLRNQGLSFSQYDLTVYATLQDNDAVLCLTPRNTDPSLDRVEVIDGRTFYYSQGQQLLDYRYGVISARWPVQDALLDQLYNAHKRYNPTLYTPSDEIRPMVELDAEKEAQFQKYFYDYFSLQNPIKPEDIRLYIYGQFGTKYIMRAVVQGYEEAGETQGPYYLHIGKYVFVLPDMRSGSILFLYDESLGQRNAIYPLDFVDSTELITDEQLREVFLTYRQNHLELYYPEAELPEWYLQTMALRAFNDIYYSYQDVRELRYVDYGVCGNALVFMVEGVDGPQELSQEYVVEYLFYYPTWQWISVYADGEILSLEEGYAEGWIQPADLERIYELHLQRYPQLYTPPLPTIRRPEADQQHLQQIKDQLSADRYGNMSLFYYGTYGGVEFYRASNLYQSIVGTTYLPLDKLLFICSSNDLLLVYQNGEIMDLEAACKSGMISHEQLRRFHELYVMLNWQSYYPDAQRTVDWDLVDFATVDRSILGRDTQESWMEWLSQASLEQVILSAYLRPDGAFATAYEVRIGEFFLLDPVLVIQKLARQPDPVLQDYVIHYLAGGEVYFIHEIDQLEFLYSIRLPEEASDLERWILQQVIETTEEYLQGIPPIG